MLPPIYTDLAVSVTSAPLLPVFDLSFEVSVETESPEPVAVDKPGQLSLVADSAFVL
jgi:hypothetical protein